MVISAKARLVSIIVAVVFMFGALAGGGAYLIVKHLNQSNALKGGSTIGDIINSSNRAYVNQTTYNSLMSKLGNKVGSVSALDAGTPIVFTMAGRQWQVVYRDPNNPDIITVWMTEPYTSAVFDGSSYVWNGSDIQATLNSYYNTQIRTYTVMADFVFSPSQMSSAYQSAQAQNGSYGGYTSDEGLLSGGEYFWLPSLYEAFSLWGLDDNDRGFDNTSVSSYCWLRSGSL